MNALQKKTFTILLIDDNVAHAFLTREILKESRMRNTVHERRMQQKHSCICSAKMLCPGRYLI
jgi:hypothetical protein